MEDEADVEAEPPPPDLPALLPTVLLTNTGVSYFNKENPCYAELVLVYWN